MSKDFDKWNNQKKLLDDNTAVQFRRGDIWWCSVGVNIGDEQDGKNENFERPVLVARKFSKHLFWGVPLTSKAKEGEYYFTLEVRNTDRTLMISQLRVLSSKRLIRKMSKISENKLATVQGQIDLIMKTTPSKKESRIPCGSLYSNLSKDKRKSQGRAI